MAFRMRPSKPLSREVQKAARDELKRVIGLMTEPVADREESIHQLRVGMKRQRALLRIVRDVLGEEHYSAGLQRCKALADRYSDSRDAAVASTLLAELLSALPDPELRTRIETAFRSSIRPGGPRSELDSACELLREMRQDVREWPLQSLQLEHLGERLGRQYRRAARLYRAVGDDTAMALMHEWRKEIKRLLYQLELIRPADGAPKIEKRLKRLGSWLGKVHDLDMLELQMESRIELYWLDDRLSLQKLMREQRGHLRDRALTLAKKVFDDSPKAFARGRVLEWQRGR